MLERGVLTDGLPVSATASNCPEHSHYEVCAQGCQPTCGNLTVTGACGSACYESCVCDDGFVLSGNSCVAPESCGCVHNGTYHPPGQTFYPGPECDSLCTCQAGGQLSCEPSSCGPQETCQVSDGVLGCVPVSSATCQASGDPHYVSFDGRYFDFMGTCVYVLAKSCGNSSDLPEFTVLQDNEPWGNGYASATKAITVLVGNYTIFLEQNQRKVLVRMCAWQWCYDQFSLPHTVSSLHPPVSLLPVVCPMYYPLFLLRALRYQPTVQVLISWTRLYSEVGNV